MFPFVLYLPASVQGVYFPSNLSSLSIFVLHSTEMSIRMPTNLYKCLTTTTNALLTIRMACGWFQICCEWLQICCKYAFLANLRSMFLIFVKPRNRARMLTKAYECLEITLRSMRIGHERIRRPICYIFGQV